jgi:hypothetical protein
VSLAPPKLKQMHEKEQSKEVAACEMAACKVEAASAEWQNGTPFIYNF